MSIIRFPVAARLGEFPMAIRVSWFERVKRNLYGHNRPRTRSWNTLGRDHARRR